MEGLVKGDTLGLLEGTSVGETEGLVEGLTLYVYYEFCNFGNDSRKKWF